MPCPLSKKKCRWTRRKEARPEEILSAALELFVERGFMATKLDDVARHAGVSKGTVYLYFESKEALFRSMVQEMLVPQVERAEQQALQHTAGAQALLRHMVMNWWETVGGTRLEGLPKLMVAEAGNFPELATFFVDKVARRTRRLFEKVLQQGIEKGEFRACNTGLTARLLMAPMVFAAVWEHSLRPYDDGYDIKSYLELHLDLFLNGLLVDPERK